MKIKHNRKNILNELRHWRRKNRYYIIKKYSEKKGLANEVILPKELAKDLYSSNYSKRIYLKQIDAIFERMKNDKDFNKRLIDFSEKTVDCLMNYSNVIILMHNNPRNIQTKALKIALYNLGKMLWGIF